MVIAIEAESNGAALQFRCECGRLMEEDFPRGFVCDCGAEILLAEALLALRQAECAVAEAVAVLG